MMSPPFCSCLCPTYNRFPHDGWLLGEAVESFLRCAAEYGGGSELVILNDAPSQKIRCDLTNVRVINATRRFATLGDKRNALVAFARGSVMLPWDDDDLSFSDRITLAAGALRVGAGVWNPRFYWFADGDGPWEVCCNNSAHNASAFTKSAWVSVGGYPSISGGEDQIIDAKFRSDPLLTYVDGKDAFMLPQNAHYVYRWNVSGRHLSASHDIEANYAAIGAMPVVPGVFTVVPKWRMDYEAKAGSTG